MKNYTHKITGKPGDTYMCRTTLRNCGCDWDGKQWLADEGAMAKIAEVTSGNFAYQSKARRAHQFSSWDALEFISLD